MFMALFSGKIEFLKACDTTFIHAEGATQHQKTFFKSKTNIDFVQIGVQIPSNSYISPLQSSPQFFVLQLFCTLFDYRAKTLHTQKLQVSTSTVKFVEFNQFNGLKHFLINNIRIHVSSSLIVGVESNWNSFKIRLIRFEN